MTNLPIGKILIGLSEYGKLNYPENEDYIGWELIKNHPDQASTDGRFRFKNPNVGIDSGWFGNESLDRFVFSKPKTIIICSK